MEEFAVQCEKLTVSFKLITEEPSYLCCIYLNGSVVPYSASVEQRLS